MAELKIIKASEVECHEIEWLWYPFIPYGKVTVIQGDSGDGKSLMVLKLAAMLTQGEAMPFTDGGGQEPINVIYQSSEDDADDTIVPRFIKAGGDPERLLFISEQEKFLTFSDKRLLEALRETKARLLILDPLSAYVGEKTQINSANEVRAQFRPLIEMAKELQAARSEGRQQGFRFGGCDRRSPQRASGSQSREGTSRRKDTGAGQMQCGADRQRHYLFRQRRTGRVAKRDLKDSR